MSHFSFFHFSHFCQFAINPKNSDVGLFLSLPTPCQKFYIRYKTSICQKRAANKAAIFATDCEKLFLRQSIPSMDRIYRPIADGFQSKHSHPSLFGQHFWFHPPPARVPWKTPQSAQFFHPVNFHPYLYLHFISLKNTSAFHFCRWQTFPHSW